MSNWQWEIRVRMLLLISVLAALLLLLSGLEFRTISYLLILQIIFVWAYNIVTWDVLMKEEQRKLNYVILLVDGITGAFFVYFIFAMHDVWLIKNDDIYVGFAAILGFLLLCELAFIYLESFLQMIALLWYAASPGIVPWDGISSNPETRVMPLKKTE